MTEEVHESGATEKSKLDLLLVRLPNMMNRKFVDEVRYYFYFQLSIVFQ